MNRGTLYLGRVERRRDLGEPVAELTPLYEATPDMLGWYRPITASLAEQLFPRAGQVLWPRPPSEAARGSLWIFEVEPQPIDVRAVSDQACHQTAHQPVEALEVIDLGLNGNDDPDVTRVMMTEEGIELRFLPSRSVHLSALEGWVGPVSLVQEPDTRRWRVAPNDLKHPLPVYAPAPAEHTSAILIDNHERCILPPEVQPGKQVMQIDWAPDHLLLRTVLRDLQGQNGEHADRFRQAREALHGLMAIGEPPTRLQRSLGRQRLRRALSLTEELANDRELGEQVVGELLSLPSVASAIETHMDDALRSAREQAQRELQDERRIALESLQREKTELEAHVAQLKIEERQLAEHTEELGERLQGEIDKLDSTLKEKIAELKAYPEKALAEAIVLRTVLGLGTNSQSAGSGDRTLISVPSGSFSWSADEASTAVRPLNDSGQLRRALTNTFRSRHLPSAAAGLLHAGFLSGAFAILAGARASEALEAYAETVAGGRWQWLPVTAATLEPCDLLGRVDAACRCFQPAPGGLIDLLLEAPDRDQLYLVVLEGINLAAIEAYLMPVVACYRDAWRSGRRRALPLFHPTAVRPDDPYVRAQQLAWPPNVLLAGTLSDGVATIPPPASMWDVAVLLNLDHFAGQETSDESDPIPNGRSTSAERSFVSLTVWRKWRTTSHNSADPKGAKTLRRMETDGFLRPTNRWEMLNLLLAELAEQRSGAAEVLYDVISSRVIPQAVAIGRGSELLNYLQSLGLVSPRLERSLEWAESVLAPFATKR